MCLLGISCSDLFRDYGGVIVSALPAVAAFLAMIIAQYFKERPIAKALFVAAAGLLILASIWVNAAYQHQLNAEKATNVTRQAAIREQLGKFIEEGKGIKDKCEDETVPLPNDAATDWDKRTASFLDENLGASYVTRFRDQTGALPPVVNSPVERRGLWLGVYVRVFRLEEFSRQSPL
jgi:hypothetical protein